MQSILHQHTHARELIASFLQFLRSIKKTILLILVVVAITLLVSTIISVLLTRTHTIDVPSLGHIKTRGVEAYWDINMQNETEEINWGTFWLGSSNNITIYLLSVSNVETTLSLTKANLTFYNTNEVAIHPPNNISIYMNLSWDYNGSVVKPGGVIQVTLTLSADYSPDFISYLIENDIRRFSLDILISVIEYIT